VEVLVLRTAAPFGYAFFIAGLLFAATVGIVFVFRGLRKSQHFLAAGGLVLVLGVAAIVWANIDAERDVDLNPSIVGDEALVGVWTHGDTTLRLSSDHAYQCSGRNCEALGALGMWSRLGDFEILFRPADDRVQRRRVVSAGRRLRLTEMPEDPDMWNGRLTFGMTAHAS
jgi:hypothetical protein